MKKCEFYAFWILAILFSELQAASQGPSLFQIKANVQPRSGGKFAKADDVEPLVDGETYHQAAIRELKQILKRGEARGRKQQRRYPRSYSSPKDEAQRLERRDGFYLNNYPSRRIDHALPPGGEADQIYEKIMKWKEEIVHSDPLENYITRLKEIRARGLARAAQNPPLQKYPKRDNHGSLQSKDSVYLHKKPKDPEALGIWEEIRAWKSEPAPSITMRRSKSQILAEKADAESSGPDSIIPDDFPLQNGAKRRSNMKASMGDTDASTSSNKRQRKSGASSDSAMLSDVEWGQDANFMGMGSDPRLQSAWIDNTYFDTSLQEDRVSMTEPLFTFSFLHIYFFIGIFIFYIVVKLPNWGPSSSVNDVYLLEI